jgi:phosphoglycolate phosphatase-like HAD superfamily hydrolase
MKDEGRALIAAALLVCWDFDGVIKESVQIKTEAFHDLFLSHGPQVAQRVREHHLAHGGMSRFQKIPLYLEWAGLEPTAQRVDEYCEAFARAVEDAVVACAWVQGAQRMLLARPATSRYILVTATPQEEIEGILERLAIRDCFSRVYGAPTPKAQGIAAALADYSVKPGDALMIGDSKEDLRAAQQCGVKFLLRRTPENTVSMTDYNGAFLTHFE